MTDNDDVHSHLVSRTLSMDSQDVTCAFGFLALAFVVELSVNCLVFTSVMRLSQWQK